MDWQLMLEHGEGGYYLAGGTDLVIAMKGKGLVPGYVVDLKIPGLSGVRETADEGLSIGALTTMRALETSPIIRSRYPTRAKCCRGWLDPNPESSHRGGQHGQRHAVSRRGTTLLTLDTTVRLSGADGQRLLELENFFRGDRQRSGACHQIEDL